MTLKFQMDDCLAFQILNDVVEESEKKTETKIKQ